jgi:2-amino-4-hydroxy-6-hydroxymethyldihydropteridine diphosphokinase
MEKKLNHVYLGLGSNLGDKIANLNQALNLISMELGAITRTSSYYFSEPQGFISENEFVNLVIKVESKKLPLEILEGIQKIERLMGRTSNTTGQYQDRIIDIDILFHNSDVINEVNLVIPHPLILQREFVKSPLLEILDDLALLKLCTN